MKPMRKETKFSIAYSAAILVLLLLQVLFFSGAEERQKIT